MKLSHRQELAILDLLSVILATLSAMLATGQIPVNPEYAWVVALALVVINRRSSWLPGLFNLGPEDLEGRDV